VAFFLVTFFLVACDFLLGMSISSLE